MGNRDGVYLLTIPGRLPNLNDYIDAERRNRRAADLHRQQAQIHSGMQGKGYSKHLLPHRGYGGNRDA